MSHPRAGQTIMVATPCYGGMVTDGYLQSMFATAHHARENGVQLALYTLGGESLVSRARNNLVTTLYDHPEYDAIFFIDADQVWEWESFNRVLSANVDIACGIYPKKKIHWDELIAAAKTMENKSDIIAQGLQFASAVYDPSERVDGFARVRNGATGFMRIDRSVIEKMVQNYPELKYSVDPYERPGEEAYCLFDTMLTEGVYLGEDFAFCRRWQEMGGEIWADMDGPIVRHIGTTIYGATA